MYQTPIRSDELYHHGILGMKWGKRNGPPYPLMASSHSASEKKAGWQKSLDRGSIGHYSSYGSASKEIHMNTQSTKKKSSAANVLEQNIKMGKGKENQSPAERMTKETQRSAEQASRLAKRAADAKRAKDAKTETEQKQDKISKMSDKELQDAIRRIELERRYDSLTRSELKNGADKVAEIMDTVGDVAGIAASVATVAAIFYSKTH